MRWSEISETSGLFPHGILDRVHAIRWSTANQCQRKTFGARGGLFFEIPLNMVILRKWHTIRYTYRRYFTRLIDLILYCIVIECLFILRIQLTNDRLIENQSILKIFVVFKITRCQRFNQIMCTLIKVKKLKLNYYFLDFKSCSSAGAAANAFNFSKDLKF